MSSMARGHLADQALRCVEFGTSHVLDLLRHVLQIKLIGKIAA
jgi:hypothetical protein